VFKVAELAELRIESRRGLKAFSPAFGSSRGFFPHPLCKPVPAASHDISKTSRLPVRQDWS